MATISAAASEGGVSTRDQEIAGLREHIARLEDTLREALPHVARIAATCPMEPRRRARQLNAVIIADKIRRLTGTASRTEDALRSAQRE